MAPTGNDCHCEPRVVYYTREDTDLRAENNRLREKLLDMTVKCLELLGQVAKLKSERKEKADG
jgi:hypothetical protein